MILARLRPLSALLMILCAALMVLLIVVALLVAGLLYTEAGSRYISEHLNERYPALALTVVKGDLLRGLDFGVTYHDVSTAVSLSNVRLRIAPSCLLTARLCVEELSANRLSITVFPTEDAPANDAPWVSALPAIRAPLPISFQRLRLDNLVVIKAQKSLFNSQSIVLRGSWRGTRIRVEQAEFAYQGCRGKLSGTIELREFYPLQTRVHCDRGSELRSVNAGVSGDLKRLYIAFESLAVIADRHWPLRGKLSLSPLESETVVELEAKLDSGVLLADQQLELRNAELRASGTLQQLATELKLSLASPHWQDDSQLHLQGAVSFGTEPSPRLLVDLHQLHGSLMQQPISGRGKFSWHSSQLRIETLDLALKANRFNARGLLAADSALKIELDLPALQQLWPPVRGGLSGTLVVSSALQRPDIRGQLRAQVLHYRQLQSETGRLRFYLAQLGDKPSELKLTLNKVVANEQPLGDVELVARGTMLQHRLDVLWHRDKYHNGSIGCDGALVGQGPGPEVWQGNCETSTVRLGGQPWMLADSVSLTYDSGQQQLALAPACWHSTGSSFCTNQAITVTAESVQGLSLTGRNLPWGLLEPWLPENIRPEGRWHFKLTGEMVGGQPALTGSIDSSGSQLHWPIPGGDPLTVTLAQLEAELRLNNGRLELRGVGDAQEYGRLNAELYLESDAIDGSLLITDARLTSLAPLIQLAEVQSIAGRLEANIRVSGKRLQPTLHGSIRLRDGRADLEEPLPTPLEAIQLTVDFEEHGASLYGDFSIASAPGRLIGQLAWGEPGWRGELSVDVDPFLLQLDHYAEIVVAPELNLTLAPERLQLQGQLVLPWARVKLKQLPPEAIRPSPDALIVRRKPIDRPAELLPSKDKGPELVSELRLVLGDDVAFQGFGLDTRLRGQLLVSQKPEEGTRANGVVSLYQGRYRAYGQALTIRHGDLIFVGDVDNPQLRIEAVRELDDDSIVVGLRASGSARQPVITLFSQPDMAQQEKLHYLITGRAPDSEEMINSTNLAVQTALSLGLKSGDSVLNETAQAIGIEDFRVSVESGHSGPEMRLSGYLSTNLMVRYGIGVFEAVNSLTLRYKVARDLYIEVVSGEASSLDLLWSVER